MMARLWNCRFVCGLALALGLAAFAVQPANAGNLDKLDTSLKIVPADVAFYGSMLRNREKIEAIAHSQAWAKIMAMPTVQMGVALYNMQLGDPDSKPSQVQAVLNNPEMQKILAVLAAMCSDEIFVYGDKNFNDFIRLVQGVNAAQTYGPLMALADCEKPEGDAVARAQGGAIVTTLADNVDHIGLPGLVIGFRLKDTALAKEELARLEVLARNLADNFKQTKGRLQKTAVAGTDYLVLTLDGAMIPWDEESVEKFRAMETRKGDADKVIAKVKKSNLVIAIGLRGNDVLLSIGPSLECLEKIGKGPCLIGRKELKPLEPFADRKLLSVGYVSETLKRQGSGQKKNVDEALAFGDRWLAKAKLPEDQKLRIRNDIESLSKDAKTLVPEVGASMGFSFQSERGIEGYAYDWSEHRGVDASQPLSLLEHVGGNPIFGLVSHQKTDVKDYDLMVKWLKIGYGYFRDFALPAMDKDERKKTEAFLTAAMPWFERLDKANREMLFPALADGQSGFVLDAKLVSKQFCKDMPKAKDPMPMFEPAVLMSVSDAKLLKNGLSEYRAVINGLIDAMRNVEGTDVPKNIQIPEPVVTEDSLGTIYSYVLPAEWGVDKQIEPNIAISDKVAALSISRDHAKRLLKATPLGVGGVLDKGQRPVAVAAWFDWASLVNAASPWTDFAIDQAVAANPDAQPQKQMISAQIHTVLDVLKVVRIITFDGIPEQGAFVIHSLTEIRDLK